MHTFARGWGVLGAAGLRSSVLTGGAALPRLLEASFGISLLRVEDVGSSFLPEISFFCLVSIYLIYGSTGLFRIKSNSSIYLESWPLTRSLETRACRH